MELNIGLSLGSTNTGLTLNAQVIDISGVNVGSGISAGFTTIGNGHYFWQWTVEDTQRGGIKFYEEAAPSSVLAFTAIDISPANIMQVNGYSVDLDGSIDANVTEVSGVPVSLSDFTQSGDINVSGGVVDANIVSISGVVVGIDSDSVADSDELSTLGDLLIRRARIVRLLP